MVSRVLRDLGADKQQIIVLNDEAHHCYQDKPLPAGEKADKEQKAANEEARVWFKGLQAIAKHVGIKQVCRPLRDAVLPLGLRLQRGLHLPLDGQRLLADGRDRVRASSRCPVPRSTTTPPTRWSPTCGCGTSSATSCPSGPQRTRSTDWLPPPELEGALRSLHRSYEKAFAHWEAEAGAPRRDAAGVHRRLPEHGRQQARLRLDRRRADRGDGEVDRRTSPATSSCSATSWTASRWRGRGRS